LEALASNQPLQPRHRDHALSGEWSDHRDCHVKPDLVLIYRKPDESTLQLVRIGSHSELGL
jgi:mRNA interferase YafQ